jgi:hypothetical protein
MMELLEREGRWDVDDHFVLPPLYDLIGRGDIDRTTVELSSAYYDTADHDLQSHGVSFGGGMATTPVGSSRFQTGKSASISAPRAPRHRRRNSTKCSPVCDSASS